jgi:hypothetical protein
MTQSKSQVLARDILERAIAVDLNRTKGKRMRTFRELLPEMGEGLIVSKREGRDEIAESRIEEFDASMIAHLIPALEKVASGANADTLSIQETMSLSHGAAIARALKEEASYVKSEERKIAHGQRTNVLESLIREEGYAHVAKKLNRLCHELGLSNDPPSPPLARSRRF